MEHKAQKTPTSERKKQVTPNEYLFEKMYTGGVDDDSPEAVPPTEYELYKEARRYDKVVKSGGLPQPTKSVQEPTHALRKSLPVAPTKPRPDVPDNLSETGTYTIEAEPDRENDFEMSRKSIDKIFGVEAAEEDVRLNTYFWKVLSISWVRFVSLK